METRHYTSVQKIPRSASFQLSPKWHLIFLGLVFVGVVSFVGTLRLDAERAWHSYLVSYFFFFSLSLSGLFFVALSYLTRSAWATPLRRVPESLIGFLPVAFILMLLLLKGTHSLYEWSHHDVVSLDALLKGKSSYLNLSFFTIRNVAFFLVWMGIGFWFIKNSLKQDENGDARITVLNRAIAAPFLVFFGLSFTVASFDWLMSLEPYWFSTIFGVYCFAGLFESGMAMMILWVVALRRQGPLAAVVNENHLHDLGKLMFAFCVFWAYIAFSQYMLIWYGNLPEEIGYMIKRTQGPWAPIGLALLFGKFIIPFFLLISRPAKRNENYLLFVALWVLASQWLDIYWMVYPMMGDPIFGWQELGVFAGFLGLFVLSVAGMLGRMAPIPYKDPWLLEGVNHHQ